MVYASSSAHWPIIEFRFSGQVSESDATKQTVDLEQMIERDEPFLVVCDLTGLSMPGGGCVRAQMEWMRTNLPQITAMNRGTAFVLPNALTRGMLRALRHFMDLPFPVEVFDTPDAAREWARARLQTL